MMLTYFVNYLAPFVYIDADPLSLVPGKMPVSYTLFTDDYAILVHHYKNERAFEFSEEDEKVVLEIVKQYHTELSTQNDSYRE